MMSNEDMKQTLAYIQSELDRVQTIAGTLSSVENTHFQDLTDMGDDKLNQLATEEQNAARQLGEVKQICSTLSQKMADLQQQFGESNV